MIPSARTTLFPNLKLWKSTPEGRSEREKGRGEEWTAAQDPKPNKGGDRRSKELKTELSRLRNPLGRMPRRPKL